MNNRLPSRSRTALDESGAVAVEFAFIGPIVLALVFGLIYVLLAVAAHVSVAHGTSVGARFASIRSTDTGLYPTPDEVEAKVASASPFARPELCTTDVTGDEGPNAVVHVDVSCPFPNPFGRVASALFNLRNPEAELLSPNIGLHSDAKARRE